MVNHADPGCEVVRVAGLAIGSIFLKSFWRNMSIVGSAFAAYLHGRTLPRGFDRQAAKQLNLNTLFQGSMVWALARLLFVSGRSAILYSIRQ